MYSLAKDRHEWYVANRQRKTLSRVNGIIFWDIQLLLSQLAVTAFLFYFFLSALSSLIPGIFDD